ncbi:uncharacterized protein N7487_000455 [Penicillium crustosum]|uniref:uncharacterized protein n=1 Tax=Penicillium crustosum TaxID=36656 RepID=UPI002382E681|nr:uncharacterized protein N7487_000455 [Penicillium crustosum]KAJ5416905.1 hypothetical protein N7487_000455 [Penicillium crustosum]
MRCGGYSLYQNGNTEASQSWKLHPHGTRQILTRHSIKGPPFVMGTLIPAEECSFITTRCKECWRPHYPLRSRFNCDNATEYDLCERDIDTFKDHCWVVRMGVECPNQSRFILDLSSALSAS